MSEVKILSVMGSRVIGLKFAGRPGSPLIIMIIMIIIILCCFHFELHKVHVEAFDFHKAS